jgi:hypothetical protein
MPNKKLISCEASQEINDERELISICSYLDFIKIPGLLKFNLF